jgi:hypothetical protein
MKEGYRNVDADENGGRNGDDRNYEYARLDTYRSVVQAAPVRG